METVVKNYPFNFITGLNNRDIEVENRDMWACTVCENEENQPFTTKCSICETERIVNNISTIIRWTCNVCTCNENHPVSTICSVCGSERTTSKENGKIDHYINFRWGCLICRWECLPPR